MDRQFRTMKGDYSGESGRYMEVSYSTYNRSAYSAEVVGEERGYVQGVEDERKKFRLRMNQIIVNLKARGYPLINIAEDTGYSLEEIRVI